MAVPRRPHRDENGFNPERAVAAGDYAAFGGESELSGLENHVGKGPRGWKRTDAHIYEEVCELLTHNPDIDASEIEVIVKDGVVGMRGFVENRFAKWLAEDEAASVAGVKDVMNELRVDRTMFDHPIPPSLRKSRASEEFYTVGTTLEKH